MPTRTLDPRASAAISCLRADPRNWTGPILLRNLPSALPSPGERHSWRDAVTVFLLCELVSVHRVNKEKNPYWRGNMYQVNRTALAKQFNCDPDAISKSLAWLRKLRLVHVAYHTRHDGIGKPCGTEVYAAPSMDKIKEMLDIFAKEGHCMTVAEPADSDTLEAGAGPLSGQDQAALKPVSAAPQPGLYLNCVKSQQKHDAESGGGTSADVVALQNSSVRRNSTAAVGGSAADPSTQVPPAFQEHSARPHNTGGRTPLAQSSPTSPARWKAPEPPARLEVNDDAAKAAWQKAARFGELWAEARMREGNATTCRLTSADLTKAFEFFTASPQNGAFYLTAIAVNAWRAAERFPKHQDTWDRLYHCRDAQDVQSFIRFVEAGKVESEIGRLGWKINAYEDLRGLFTQSELEFFGFRQIPQIAIQDDELWENAGEAIGYYRKRHRPLPQEIRPEAD